MKERFRHTPTASRFGYDRFYNEYGVGEQAFGYIEANECHSCGKDTPADMAPKRFYDAYHIEAQGRSEFRKMNAAPISMLYPYGLR